MTRSGATLCALVGLSFATMATAQTITDAFTQLRNHINGVTTLTAAQINSQAAIINQNVAQLGTDAAVIADALNLVSTYETKKGALFTVAPTKGGYLRAASGFELPNAMLDLEQGILDRTYTAACLAQNESLLNGWKIKSSAHFPGSVTPPADPNTTFTVSINASQPKVWGAPVLYYNADARRPTGCYLAPGSIGVVTVPAALVGKGFKVRVGAHSWDLSAKDRIERLDRVSRVFTITSTTTKIANPLGGGIYIEVPYLANAGIVSVQIANAVRSPFFSATSHHQTTLTEWQQSERTQPGPWADFETDKFMMQVPRSWIYAYANPVSLMANWDKAMDAVSELFGLPLVRSKTVMYAQVDVIMRADVNAPGYPCVNDTYDPYATTNGNKSHYLLTGPQNSPWATLHELGHGHSFTKFSGEIESAVNLLYVAALNRKFGMALEAAFGESIGAGGSTDMSNITLKNVSLMWTLKNVFRTGNQTMLDADMRYEHKGHAKYVEIAKLLGWEALGDFWHSVHVDYENGIDYPENTDPTDSRIVRMSKAAKVDLRPLLHFWGVPPLNATNVRNAINAAGLPPSGAIYRRLVFYRDSVPATQSAYNNFYWAIDETGPDAEIKAMFDDSTYTTAIANSAINAIQDIIDLYFPNGDPDIVTRTWDVSPGIAGAGNGAVNTGDGTWSTTAANWTADAGANNTAWVNVSHAAFASGTYAVTVGSGVSVGDLTVATGDGNVTLRSATDNGGLTLAGSPDWKLNDNVLNLTADAVNDTKLTMTSGETLTVSGTGTFNTGEKPAGADWGVAGSSLAIQGTLTLRGNASGVGKFSSINMAAGTGFIHERNTSEIYANNWSLTGSGQVVFDSRFVRTATLSGIISGSAGMTFNESAVLSGANTYTGATIVSTGTVALTGNRTASAGAITVGNVNGSTATLNISNGTYSVGTVTVGSGDSTAGGILNQIGGSLTLTGNTQLIIGNGTGASGTYNLSGGTLTGGTATTRGIILGTNNGTTGTFNLSGSGNLALGSAVLMVARSDAALTSSSGYFNQTAGTAVIGNVTVAGGSGSGSTGHLNLTGGNFSATSFASLASAAASSATITLGGTALATLPAFPTARGAGSTATLNFDGGTLIPAAASTTYLGGLTNAFIKSGGAKFDVASGRDITVSQRLLADTVSAGGGLTKSGAGKLTLSSANTYTGNTTVSAGTLELAAGGSLKFVPTANGVSNKITGAAAILLKGAFVIDLSGAAATNGNSWSLVDVGTLAETFDPSFSVTGFTETSNVWRKTAGTTVWTFTESNGVLACSAPVGLLSWLSGFALGTENQAGDDFDHDGMNHLLEYVLNGNPTVSDPAVLPDLEVTDTAFEFTYFRLDLSLTDTLQSFAYGSDLTGWQTVPIPAGPGSSNVGIATVTIIDTGSTDSIKVSIPKTANQGTGFFGRLQVTR